MKYQSIPNPTKKSLEGEMKVNKLFGTNIPLKGNMKYPKQKITKRKKKVMKAATKLMGGLK